MKTKYLKVMNNNNGIEGAVIFDESISFAQRVEITELIRQSDYHFIEITKDEYNIIHKKFEL